MIPGFDFEKFFADNAPTIVGAIMQRNFKLLGNLFSYEVKKAMTDHNLTPLRLQSIESIKKQIDQLDATSEAFATVALAFASRRQDLAKVGAR